MWEKYDSKRNPDAKKTLNLHCFDDTLGADVPVDLPDPESCFP
jgi:hypothetical protein